MATATATRSRSSSRVDDGRPTFVNFSTPQRTMSVKSDVSTRWREHAMPDDDEEQQQQQQADEVLPYRPVKTNYVQWHVTSGANANSTANATAPRPSFSNTSRPASRNRDAASVVDAPTLDKTRTSFDAARTTTVQAAQQPARDPRPQLAHSASTHSRSLSSTAQSSPATSTHERPNRFARSFSFSKKPVKGWPSHVQQPPPSPGGSYRFHEIPSLRKTPWEIERGKPKSRWARSSIAHAELPARIFRELPKEIYQCILDHVENVHTQGALLDVRGSRADLGSLSLVDRKWNRVAKDYLYRELWLPSNRAVEKRKFLRQPRKSKLRLLQNTLAASPGTAFLVAKMHITAALADEIEIEANGSVVNGSTIDTVQSIFRQCYNLERVTGFIWETSTATFPLAQALATRTRLQAHAWNLNPEKQLPGLAAFMSCHDQWKNMDSLAIAGASNVDLGKIAVSTILTRLPKLKHLMLSGLHNDDFHHGSLVALPALTSLRLENLAGITEQGIHQLAFSRLAPRLERLSLVGLEVKALETVQTLLLHLTKLKAFVFVQDASPELRRGRPAMNSFNLLASNSLEYLHWDCLVLGSAISRFGEAIRGGRFPQLRKVKIPCDFDGTIQTLCRPIPQVTLTQKDMNYLAANFHDSYERNLLVSQIQAQLRIQKYRRTPSFRFAVQDDLTVVGMPHDIGSCIGNPDSRIEYSMQPGVDASALAEFGEVARPRKTGNERMERRVDMQALF